MHRAVYLVFALLLAQPSMAVQFETVEYADKRFTVIKVDPAKEKLRLFHDDEDGSPFSHFRGLAEWLEARGEVLEFAMNAGMFHPDQKPVGLFVSDGVTKADLNENDGWGNFFLKPNGVFYLNRDGQAGIAETHDFRKLHQRVLLATQSGPLLVNHGAIHNRLTPKSKSRYIRNGVGLSQDGLVLFVISETRTNLYEFAAFFQQGLRCRQALYFDGAVSSLYAPAMQRKDYKTNLGPIIGVTH